VVDDQSARAPKTIGKVFGDLKVRPKLMVLHNVFFLILVAGVYLAIYPYLPAQAKAILFIVLGAIYILAVLALETTIMPLYVYRPLRLMRVENQAGDCDRDEQNRRHRKDRVERERCPHARRIILAPSGEGSPDEPPDLLCAHPRRPAREARCGWRQRIGNRRRGIRSHRNLTLKISTAVIYAPCRPKKPFRP